MSYAMAKTAIALVFALPGLFALAAPKAASAVARAFPRHELAGRLLSAAAFLWAAAIVWFLPLDFLERFKLPLAIAMVVAIPLSWAWMKELLAARALGALWCLLPAPVLHVARFAPGGGRLVVVTLAYVVAVCGMFVAFSPYFLRDALFWAADRPASRMRPCGAVLLVCGLAAAFA